MVINKKTIATTALTLGVLAGITMSDKVLDIVSGNFSNSHTASAMGISDKDITYVPDISSGVDFEIDSDTEGASFSWGAAGATSVVVEQGSVVGDVLDSQYNNILGDTNQPRVSTTVYSLNAGDRYRLTNVGKTESGQALDVVATINSATKDSHSNSTYGPRTYNAGIAFQNSSNLGTNTDPHSAIGVLVFGWEKTDITYKYVKAGTNEAVKVTTATYWSDIDIWQGINENASNKKVIMSSSDETKKWLATDDRWVYALDPAKDFDGLNDANESAYIGVGEGDSVNIKYDGIYRGGRNSYIAEDDTWYGLRYDLFGLYSNLKITPQNKLTEPKKTVSDSDEKDLVDNNSGLVNREQEYNVSAKTAKGKFKKLTMVDNLPKEFTTSVDKIKVFAGDKDVTSLFDVKLEGQKVTATLKKENAKAAELQNTTLRVNIKGTDPEWLGGTFNNKATWDDGFSSQETNNTTSTVPDKPVVDKTVSTTGEFKTAAKPEEAEKVNNRPDDYIWKLDFTLSNYSEFSKIELSDNMESLQTVDLEKVKVFDWDGNDVTAQGTVKSTPKGDKNVITWSANADELKTVNAKFGKKSKEKPKFTMRITTNVKDATNEQESKYYNKDMGVVVIPNVGTVTEGDNTGDVSVDSNTSNVQFPKPGDSAVDKKVAVDGTDPITGTWAETLSLDTHDTLYSYKTTFTLSKNFNYNEVGFTLTDKFESLQNYKEIKILDSKGTDISSKFNIKADKGDKLTTITATAKDNKEWSDNGETLIMHITGVNLTGATADQELEFLELNDFGDKDPFKEGVTIPNISNLKEDSKVPGFSKDTDSNKTFTNITVDPGISKSIEDDQSAVIDPGKATDDITEAVGDAQSAIESSKDTTSKEVKALRQALLTSSDASLIKSLSDALK